MTRRGHIWQWFLKQEVAGRFLFLHGPHSSSHLLTQKAGHSMLTWRLAMDEMCLGGDSETAFPWPFLNATSFLHWNRIPSALASSPRKHKHSTLALLWPLEGIRPGHPPASPWTQSCGRRQKPLVLLRTDTKAVLSPKQVSQCLIHQLCGMLAFPPLVSSAGYVRWTGGWPAFK